MAGGRLVPQTGVRTVSPYVPATVSPPRGLPTACAVALARSTDSTPKSMPDSMLGTEGQGATTAASPLGVFAKEDET